MGRLTRRPRDTRCTGFPRPPTGTRPRTARRGPGGNRRNETARTHRKAGSHSRRSRGIRPPGDARHSGGEEGARCWQELRDCPGLLSTLPRSTSEWAGARDEGGASWAPDRGRERPKRRGAGAPSRLEPGEPGWERARSPAREVPPTRSAYPPGALAPERLRGDEVPPTPPGGPSPCLPRCSAPRRPGARGTSNRSRRPR